MKTPVTDKRYGSIDQAYRQQDTLSNALLDPHLTPTGTDKRFSTPETAILTLSGIAKGVVVTRIVQANLDANTFTNPMELAADYGVFVLALIVDTTVILNNYKNWQCFQRFKSCLSSCKATGNDYESSNGDSLSDIHQIDLQPQDDETDKKNDTNENDNRKKSSKSPLVTKIDADAED